MYPEIYRVVPNLYIFRNPIRLKISAKRGLLVVCQDAYTANLMIIF